jgi:hypothetical protein
MLAELCEKASPFTGFCDVAAPPGSGSKGSGCVKSTAGLTTAAMRACSLGVGPAAKAAGPIAKDIKARIAAIDRCIAPITLYPPRKA